MNATRAAVLCTNWSVLEFCTVSPFNLHRMPSLCGSVESEDRKMVAIKPSHHTAMTYIRTRERSGSDNGRSKRAEGVECLSNQPLSSIFLQLPVPSTYIMGHSVASNIRHGLRSLDKTKNRCN